MPKWTDIVTNPHFLEGDLEIGDDASEHWPDGQWKQRGPIKSITVLTQDEDGGATLQIELEWVACRRNDNDDWVWAPTLDKVIEVSWRKWSTKSRIDEEGRLCLIYKESASYTSAFIYPAGLDKLDAAQVMTEYHLATHVAHRLYPPSPFEEIEHVGMVWDAGRYGEEPEVGKVIVFVIHAFSLESAEAWCRGECARLNLPIIGMKKTHLLPGY